MAQILIADEINLLLEVIGLAAWEGVREVESDFGDTEDDFNPGPSVSIDEPPAGELCDSVNVWLNGFSPIQDPANCSLIWNADIRVRLDMCGGFENPDLPLRTQEEREELTLRFLPILWGMMAGLTRAWRDGLLPGDGVKNCRKIAWGEVAPSDDEGGFLIAELQLRCQVSPQYEEEGS